MGAAASATAAADGLPRALHGATLRRLRAADLEAFQRYRAMPDLGRYQGWSPMSDAAALAFIAEVASAPLFTPGQWMQIGIADAATDRLVGDLGLHLSDDGATGEIGFTLAPEAQGRGLATMAVREALRLMFDGTAITSVRGITDARNGPSVRLLERIGFRLVETRDVVFRDEACTERVYAIARRDLVLS